jgi:putative addiction module component (TIGR02574 family)
MVGMAEPVRLTQITALSVDERIELVQAIWDSIAAETENLELTEDQKIELDRRLADLDARPDDVLTWDQIKARVRGRR